MKLRLFDGPMDGASYSLAKDAPSTNRKPDGLWFDRQDDKGRNVRDEYKEAGTIDGENGIGVDIKYLYDGETVESGIGFETEPVAE